MNDGGLEHLTCYVGVFDHYARLEDLTAVELEESALEVWRLNVLSTLLAIRAATAGLGRARGSVTLTLSEPAWRPVGGGVLYGSSKWALRGAVQHLATALAPDVRVNAVAPGGTSGTGFSGPLTLKTAGPPVDEGGARDTRIAAGTLLRHGPATWPRTRLPPRPRPAGPARAQGGRPPGGGLPRATPQRLLDRGTKELLFVLSLTVLRADPVHIPGHVRVALDSRATLQHGFVVWRCVVGAEGVPEAPATTL